MGDIKRRLVLASSNKGKIREFSEMLKNSSFEITPQSEFNLPEADETGLTFVENALIKARQASKLTGLPAIADDSGVCVDALGGAPGIYSSRYAGVNATHKEWITKLLTELQGVPEEHRTCRFMCVIVLLHHEKDPDPIIAKGVWEGRVATEPSGENGFGYDPVFWVDEYNCTAAELPSEIKHKLSHRGQALNHFINQL